MVGTLTHGELDLGERREGLGFDAQAAERGGGGEAE